MVTRPDMLLMKSILPEISMATMSSLGEWTVSETTTEADMEESSMPRRAYTLLSSLQAIATPSQTPLVQKNRAVRTLLWEIYIYYIWFWEYNLLIVHGCSNPEQNPVVWSSSYDHLSPFNLFSAHEQDLYIGPCNKVARLQSVRKGLVQDKSRLIQIPSLDSAVFRRTQKGFSSTDLC